MLAALLVAGAGVWLLFAGSSVPGPGAGGSGLDRPEGAPVDGEGTPSLIGTGQATDPTRPPRRGPGLGLEGLRVPSGMDLSDPRQARAYLHTLLTSRPIAWDDVARVVPLVDGRLSDEDREILLRELRQGDRVGAGKVFAAARDGTLVQDLFRLLDEPTLPPVARQAALQALATLPGAAPAEVVRGLEARLQHDVRADVFVLQALANRGGRDAARVIVDYLEHAEDPRQIPPFAFQGLDLAGDEEARRIVADALRPEQSTPVLVSLMRLAAQPGATEFVAPLLALDAPDRSDDLRWEALQALGRIGGAAAIDRLLDAVPDASMRGQVALRTIGGITSASTETRDVLLGALRGTSGKADGEALEVSLITALGAVRHGPAEPSFAAALDSTSLTVRLAAIQALGRLGPPAAPRVGRLLDLYARGDESEKRTVVLALAGIGDDESRRALEQMTSDASLPESVKRTIAMSLQRLREGAPERPETDGAVLGGTGGAPRSR
jgi:HEAT repeat protein